MLLYGLLSLLALLTLLLIAHLALGLLGLVPLLALLLIAHLPLGLLGLLALLTRSFVGLRCIRVSRPAIDVIGNRRRTIRA